jgi:hypothetical protein
MQGVQSADIEAFSDIAQYQTMSSCHMTHAYDAKWRDGHTDPLHAERQGTKRGDAHHQCPLRKNEGKGAPNTFATANHDRQVMTPSTEAQEAIYEACTKRELNS